jgi:hypothetical protein
MMRTDMTDMDAFVVISGAGNGFRTREEAVAYARQLFGQNKPGEARKVDRELHVMQFVETVRSEET